MTEAEVEKRRILAEKLLLTILGNNSTVTDMDYRKDAASQLLVDFTWMLADKHYDRYNDKLGYCTGEDP